MVLSLEVKVRAIKLLKIDEFAPKDILEDLETTFGIKIAKSNWDRPNQFLKRIEEGLIRLYNKPDYVHRQRLIKLLKQAELVAEDNDKESQGDME